MPRHAALALSPDLKRSDLMSAFRRLGALAAGWAVLVSGSGLADVEVLRKEPPAGEVRYGKIVYVDDGACPRGEVKEITGGNRDKSIPRKVRCVKRPK
ncbi:MAG TPA: DUF6719 family protein [Burkholderiales bacterium]|jgi:hypothetical protein